MKPTAHAGFGKSGFAVRWLTVLSILFCVVTHPAGAGTKIVASVPVVSATAIS